MASLKELRQRIRSLQNTHKLTAAMKLVASSKLKSSQKKLSVSIPFANRIDHLFFNLIHTVDTNEPLFQQKRLSKIRLCVISADRGLCGNFNHQLTKFSLEKIKEFQQQNIELEIISIGKKGYDALQRALPKMEIDFAGAVSQESLELASTISQNLITDLRKKRIDGFFIIHNSFQSILSHPPVMKQLFPPLIPKEVSPHLCHSIIEPSIKEVLQVIIPKRILSQIQLSLLESITGENGARMAAMDNASRNSADLIAHLTIEANGLRQAMITTELIEIISGSEALKG